MRMNSRSDAVLTDCVGDEVDNKSGQFLVVTHSVNQRGLPATGVGFRAALHRSGESALHSWCSIAASATFSPPMLSV